MSEENANPFTEATRRLTEGQNQFVKMWTDFAGKMASANVSFPPESTPPETARQMRASFFKAWSEHCEKYMRSPEFLDSWKKAMDGAIQFRRQMNETLGKVHHDFQGTSRQDVDQLMAALSHLERRIVDDLERTTERIREVADRVVTLEETLSDQRRKKKKKSTGKKSKKKSQKKKASKGKAKGKASGRRKRRA